MADQLYLNLWFPSFPESEILPRLLSVLRHFPYTANDPGVRFIAAHPLSWDEPTLFERSFRYPTDAESAVELLKEHVHSDFAYEVDVQWDLWVPQKEGGLDARWEIQPQTVKIVAHGTAFEDGTYQEDGHIQIDFGLDTPFLFEEEEYSPGVAACVKSNVQKLVHFTQDLEKHCGLSGRVLWSESDENLAQKLIAQLQKVN